MALDVQFNLSVEERHLLVNGLADLLDACREEYAKGYSRKEPGLQTLWRQEMAYRLGMYRTILGRLYNTKPESSSLRSADLHLKLADYVDPSVADSDIVRSEVEGHQLYLEGILDE